MLLATFTFGDALLTTLEFAFLFLWIWIAVGVLFDIFRSHDLSNWAKALWLLFIFVLPLGAVATCSAGTSRGGSSTCGTSSRASRPSICPPGSR